MRRSLPKQKEGRLLRELFPLCRPCGLAQLLPRACCACGDTPQIRPAEERQGPDAQNGRFEMRRHVAAVLVGAAEDADAAEVHIDPFRDIEVGPAEYVQDVDGRLATV